MVRRMRTAPSSDRTTALRRAVLALVDNAIDHTPDGGEVRVAVRRAGRDVVLVVSDTGPGIRPEDAERVLRRFDSGGHRSGRAHYGLGLALTHDVANRHGGQLRLVRSDVGRDLRTRSSRGSKERLRIPAHPRGIRPDGAAVTDRQLLR